MNKWTKILDSISPYKVEFNKSYKCINKSATITEKTVRLHINLLIQNYSNIRILLNVHFSKLTTKNKKEASEIFHGFRDKLLKVSSKHGIELDIPLSIHEEFTYKQQLNLTDDNTISSNTQTYKQKFTMVVTPIEFMNSAAKILPEFDGNPNNLKGFLDAISLIETIKKTHEAIVVTLVITKLKGPARDLIVGKLLCSR